MTKQHWTRLFLALLLLCALALVPVGAVRASGRINSIDVRVTVQDNGDAVVEQIWTTDVNDGTEFYIPLQNLNHMTVRDFTVSDETGTRYETLDNWDVDASFDEKAYKCGIHETSDGIELCWGKSEYGPKTYVLTWTYTDMVQNFPDEDGFLVRFINDEMDPAPDTASFILELPDTELTDENAAIWVYGTTDPINFKDGKVEWRATSGFDYGNHLTVMMAFDKDVLHPTYQGEGTFEDMFNRAMEGSDYLDDDYEPGVENPDEVYETGSRIGDILASVLSIIIFCTAAISGIRAANAHKIHKPKNARKVDIKTPEYEREVPVGGYLPALYYFYDMRAKVDMENFIAAYILKWLKEGCLGYEQTTEERGFIFKRQKEVKSFRLIQEPLAQGTFEPRLWALIERSAGPDYLLQEDEIDDYIGHHYEFSQNLFGSLQPDGYNFATMNNLVVHEKRGWFFHDYLTDDGQRELQYVFAFKRYLKDFTLLQERAPLEVELWDDYLIFATAYGMGDKVLEEFQKILPDYSFGQSSPDFYGPPIAPYQMMMIYNFSHSVGHTAMNSYTKVRNAHNRASGSGGSGSSGGGGGFSGGGSGGGSR